MKKKPVTVIAVGDILIDRDEPETIFRHVAHVLQAGDVTFANCEQMYSDKGDPRRHGPYSDPRNIPALLHAGFDVLSLANNHTLDLGSEALLDTMARFREAGIQPIGAGKNLSDARKPAIVERWGTKIGFLAYGCIGPDGHEATDTKPGYAPVHSWTLYEKVDYQPATPPRIISMPKKEDLAAMVEDIRDLKTKADVIVVSFHWGLHFVPRIIPMYCFDIGHAAVDAGADLILGTHTHILKGIEVYKGKVIFYSTSNFALEAGPGTVKDGDYVKFLAPLTKHYGIHWDPEYPTIVAHPEGKATLIVKALIEDGDIRRVSYLPCYVNRNAEPVIMKHDDLKGQEVFSYIEDISKTEGLSVHFAWDGDEVLILP